MSFQYLLYLKLDRSEENIFCYSQIFTIFEALIPYVEHKGRPIFKNVWIWSFFLSHYSDSGKLCLAYLGTNEFSE